ncbi:MAG: 6-hydroxymethylpterin diphosphokinase MptE-like protein, partial [Cyanobacteriota bacterium]
MFNKNITALKQKNPELAQKLAEHQYKDIEVFQSQSGDINISYKTHPLHDLRDPILEAQQLFNPKISTDNKHSFYIVLGLGLGYLFKRTYISSVGKIILFEPSVDVLRFTLEYVDFAQELSDNRVYICNTVEEVLQTLTNKFLIGDTIDVLLLPSYLNIYSESLKTLGDRVVSFIESIKQDQGTLIERSKEWGYNCIANINKVLNSIPIDIFKDKLSEYPVIITSAGPSLEENIELLKNNRDKYILITINTALKALLKNGLKPDFCVTVESWGIEKQFQDIKDLDDIYFILQPRTDPFAWNVSEKINMVYLSRTDGFSIWYNNILNNKYSLWPTAGTVSISAFYLASVVMQAKNIILIGQDLAFVNNQVYSPSLIEPDEELRLVDNKIVANVRDKKRNDIYNKIDIIKIKNASGNEVLSRRDYIEFVKYYEDIIGKEINKDINVINTSMNGAFIKGMIYKPFEKVSKDFKPVEIPIKKQIDKIISDNSFVIEEMKKISTKKLYKFKQDLEKKLKIVNTLIKIAEEFEKLYSRNKQDIALLALLEQFHQIRPEISAFINSNDFIFFIIQKDLLNYIKVYVTPEGNNKLTLEEHVSNIKAEQTLLNELRSHLNFIKDNFN